MVTSGDPSAGFWKPKSTATIDPGAGSGCPEAKAGTAMTTAAAIASPIHRVTCSSYGATTAPRRPLPRGRASCTYGVVVDSVNVSVLL